MASKVIALLVFLLFELHPLKAQQTWIKGGYWYSSSGMPVVDINSPLFTHLLCAFAFLNSSTNQLSITPSDEQAFSNFTYIVKSKNPSITTLLSIFTRRDNSSMFFSMIKEASYRKSFIESSIETARLYGFHGLELCGITLSLRNKSDMTNLGTLLTEWRAAVNSELRNSTQRRLLLTMAVEYLPTMRSVSYPIDLMQKNLDWVHVKGYDYYVPLRDNFTRPHAALYDPWSDVNTDFGLGEWIGRGLLASKLVLGLPYHGYAWTLVNPKDNGIGAPASGPAITQDGSVGYKFIKSYIQSTGYGVASTYNASYVVNYWTMGSNWIGFDDVEAIRTKVSYAKDKRLLGYCVWQLSNDDNWLLSRTAHGEERNQRDMQHLLMIILLPIAIVILLLGIIMCYVQQTVLKSNVTGMIHRAENFLSKVGTETSPAKDLYRNDPNLQAFSFSDMIDATNNFSIDNKLGEGGYGPVYKGTLPNRLEIAVKRLSKTSNQGLEEFKNEITLTAKLQHVNLVRILGYCTEREEKMLIYEYMSNKSLDIYLFDRAGYHQLDWRKRIHIIEGVTQGLLYLQEYSNLMVIHRDLKASNILLDNDMNPKISDFGMARIFRKDIHEANTSRIVGTYGYIPPEYVRKGVYSMKYDVFSFGVFLLQIISGKKTKSFYGSNENLNLLDYAYELWKDGRGMEFIDSSLDDSWSPCKLMRCMQIGLLCVQEDPLDRPSMLIVSSMLKNENVEIPPPKMPAFSIKRDEERISASKEKNWSINDATISEMVPR